LFMRISAGTAVFTKGNESRMGTGKGSFDYWAARVPVSRIIFEIKADVHEQVIRDAFRLAANKLPGMSYAQPQQAHV
jgi:ribosomal protein L16